MAGDRACPFCGCRCNEIDDAGCVCTLGDCEGCDAFECVAGGG